MTKAYFKGFEVIILDFYETHKWNGTECRYAKCYLPNIQSVEDVLLSDIEVVGL